MQPDSQAQNMPSWSKDPGGSLFYIIQHIFLPPRLPQKDDYSFENDIALLECLLDSLDDFKKSIPQDSQGRWKACTTLVQSLLDAREASGALDAAKIQDSLLNMTTGGRPIMLCSWPAYNTDSKARLHWNTSPRPERGNNRPSNGHRLHF